MKIKKIICLLILSFSTFSFSKIPEYKIFEKAKLEFNNSKFKNSEYFFKIFNQKFKDTNLGHTNLQNLYLGKIKIQQHKFEEAVQYLLKAPNSSEAYYLLGFSYEQLNISNTAFSFYKKAYDNCNNNLKLKEKILKSLAKLDFNYKLLYEGMFDKNFVDYWELSENDSLFIGNYFFNKKKFEKALSFFNTIESNDDLFLGKKLFCIKKYKKAIEFFKKDDSEESINLIIESYKELGEIRKSKYYRTILIKKAPHSELAASFRLQLYELEHNNGYLKYILMFNSENSVFYSKASYILNQNGILDFSKKEKKYSDLIQDLNEMAKLNMPEGIKIKLDNYNFQKEDAQFKAFLKYKYTEIQKELLN